MERIKSYTAICKSAAQQLFALLEQVEALSQDPTADESDPLPIGDACNGAPVTAIRKLAQRRHLFMVPYECVEAYEPITPTTHRQWLRAPHPLALGSDDPLCRDALALVGSFDPLAAALE